MKNSSIVANIMTKRIVTEQKGSWKWQDAYRISTYQARLADNGQVVWDVINSSSKFSFPQIIRRDLSHHPRGGLYNKPVSREKALAVIGLRGVKRIEAHGWSFA